MTSAFDTLSAAQHMQDAGMDRKHAEAVAAAIRSGQGELATKADITAIRSDITAIRSDITGIRWIIGIHFAISLATLAAVLAIVFKA